MTQSIRAQKPKAMPAKALRSYRSKAIGFDKISGNPRPTQRPINYGKRNARRAMQKASRKGNR